ncbi:MAG TPA: hypothetical protein VJB16_00710, partial [archaeon]|nr:hypothetical protein [archaeon]
LRKRGRTATHVAAHIVLAFAVSLLLHTTAEFVLSSGILTFPVVLTVVAGFVLLGISGVLEWKG